MTLLLIIALILIVGAGGLWLLTALVVSRVEATLPPQGRFVDVPGALLHVVEKGNGPALLLIHGLAGNLCHFTYGVVERLATQYRVIAVDRPGSGYSVRRPGASATLGAQAEVMAALIDALQLDRPVVVGHSLGGAVALALAQRHPQKVAALALVAPLTHAPKQPSTAFKGLMIARPWLREVVARTLALPLSIVQRDKVLGMVFGPEAVLTDFGTRGGGLLGVRPAHFVAACTDLSAAAQDLPLMERGYAEMRLPVGILYGRGDRILDPDEQGRSLAAKLPGASCELVEGGHMLPLTQVERTTNFITEVAARATSVPVGTVSDKIVSPPQPR